MGCLFSFFQEKRMYENIELSKSLINNYTQTEDYSSDDNYEFNNYPDFFETVYRRRFYTGD